jgi:hypothetical protein
MQGLYGLQTGISENGDPKVTMVVLKLKWTSDIHEPSK